MELRPELTLNSLIDPEWNPGGLYTRPHTPAHARHSLMQTHVFPPAGSHHHMHPHTTAHTRTGLTTPSTLDPTRALRASHPFCLSPLGTPSSPACGRDPGSDAQGAIDELGCLRSEPTFQDS